jgi:hypothetical protein
LAGNPVFRPGIVDKNIRENYYLDMGIGSFFKGEKKKKKKGSGGQVISAAPVFTQPEVAAKGKAKY